MNKLVLKKCLLFLFLIFVSDHLGGEFLYCYQKKSLYGAAAKDNYIADKMNEDVVILGSSRAIHHYDPNIIKKITGLSCFNAGCAGTGIILMYGRFREFSVRYMPKYIIYDVNPHYDIQNNDNSRYLSFLRAHYDCEGIDSLLWSVSPIEKYKMFSMLYPFNSRILEFLSDYFMKDDPLKNKGFSPYYGKMNYNPPKNKPTTFNVDDIKILYFQRLMKETKGKSVLIMINSPRFGGQDSCLLEPLTQLCKKYNVPFWDYSNNEQYIENKSLFNDGVHMNIDGADKFTIEVAERLNTMRYEKSNM